MGVFRLCFSRIALVYVLFASAIWVNASDGDADCYTTKFNGGIVSGDVPVLNTTGRKVGCPDGFHVAGRPTKHSFKVNCANGNLVPKVYGDRCVNATQVKRWGQIVCRKSGAAGGRVSCEKGFHVAGKPLEHSFGTKCIDGDLVLDVPGDRCVRFPRCDISLVKNATGARMPLLLDGINTWGNETKVYCEPGFKTANDETVQTLKCGGVTDGEAKWSTLDDCTVEVVQCVLTPEILPTNVVSYPLRNSQRLYYRLNEMPTVYCKWGHLTTEWKQKQHLRCLDDTGAWIWSPLEDCAPYNLHRLSKLPRYNPRSFRYRSPCPPRPYRSGPSARRSPRHAHPTI
eukprot:804333_1